MPVAQSRRVKHAAYGLLLISWASALIIAFVPVYEGEFLSPGSDVDVSGFQMIFGPLLFLMMMLSHGYVDLAIVLYLLEILLPTLLFLFTPLTLIPKLAQRNRIVIPWGVLLLASGLLWISIYTFDPGPNDLFLSIYLLPVPHFLAGAALCLLGYYFAAQKGRQ